MKRTLCLLLSVLCVMSAILSYGFNAVAEYSEEELRVMNFVEEFMEKRARTEWLYETHNLSNYFLENNSAATMSAKTTVFLDTIDYYRSFRSYNGTLRNNFQVTYSNYLLEKTSSGYTVHVSETISFVIADGQNLETIISENYTLEIVEYGNKYYISNIDIENDPFYNRVKDSGFNKATLFATHKTMVDNESLTAASTHNKEAMQPRSTTSSITYSPTTAAAYAQIYAMNCNSNFNSSPLSGGDCANFASQCIWAGFGGSNNSTAISNRLYPMDNQGSYTWWYRNSSNYTASWAGTFSIVTYANNMNSAATTENGWRSTVYDTANTSNQLPSINFCGAVLLLPGRDSSNAVVNYGHAVIATLGSTYSNIRYCGHSPYAQNALLSDYSDLSGLSRPIKVIVPSSYRLYSTCNHTYSTIPTTFGIDSVCNSCGESRLHFILPWKIDAANNSTTIYGYEASGLKPYSIDVSIYNSSGTKIKTFSTQYNKSSFSFAHNFTSNGVYTIRVDVMDCDNSTYNETNYTFYSTVRIQ